MFTLGDLAVLIGLALEGLLAYLIVLRIVRRPAVTLGRSAPSVSMFCWPNKD